MEQGVCPRFLQKGGLLKESYGVVILPKGTRLYHASSSPLCSLPKKPMIFMTLHPSEWYMEDSFISVIELQREVTLLFMIKRIHNLRVFSSLNEFLSEKNSNLAKMNCKIRAWLPHLQKEHLDGWFSSVENKTAVEFAIRNDPEMLSVIHCLPIQYNWTNSTYTNTMDYIPKNWGKMYPISSKTLPIRFHVNIRYKSQIEEYIRKDEAEDPKGTAFAVLLENAEISYFDSPLESIRWV